MNTQKKPRKFGSHNPIRISETIYHALEDGYDGICLACGSYQSGCEPDARRYVCESCDEKTVFGAQELFMMGTIELIDEEEESNFNY